MKRRYNLLIPGMLIFLVGCYYDKEESLYPSNTVDCNSVNATFTSVKPIIATKCATAGCHNAASSSGGTVLETYDQIKAKADRINQRAIIDKTMPSDKPLSANEMAALKCWLSSGAPNN
jgi:uncharacterized membrane protein